MINSATLEQATGTITDQRFEVDTLDLAKGDSSDRILTFLDDARFVDDALSNPRVKAAVVTEAIAAILPETVHFAVIVVDDPRWHFYTLHNALVRESHSTTASVIDSTAVVHPRAHVDEYGVRIGAGVVIEPNATVLNGTTIGDHTIVRAGAVLGTEGYEHKRTSRGVLSVAHDGELIIGSNCEFGANSIVAKGLSRRATIVGNDCKIDAGAFLAHCVQLQDRVFVVANATVCGSLDAADDVWIGPGAVLRDQISLGERSRVGMGSVLLSNVEADTRVLGSPAKPH